MLRAGGLKTCWTEPPVSTSPHLWALKLGAAFRERSQPIALRQQFCPFWSAISNRRLIRADADSVTFRVKDYRVEGRRRYTTMTLATHEFIRRFLMHVLPKGLHRIRHYGLLANGNRVAHLARMRELLGVAIHRRDPQGAGEATTTEPYLPPCPCCGGRMRITLIAQTGFMPRTDASPPAVIRIDTS